MIMMTLIIIISQCNHHCDPPHHDHDQHHHHHGHDLPKMINHHNQNQADGPWSHQMGPPSTASPMQSSIKILLMIFLPKQNYLHLLNHLNLETMKLPKPRGNFILSMAASERVSLRFVHLYFHYPHHLLGHELFTYLGILIVYLFFLQMFGSSD